MKNKAFLVLELVLLTVLVSLLVLYPNVSLAQVRLDTESFSIEIPLQFEQQSNEAAVLLLRHKTERFPTFNAVMASGNWPHFELSPKEQAAKLVDEYRSVGLKNAEVFSAEFTQIDSQAALYARLRYQIADAPFYSDVWVVPLKERYLVFTAVYQGQGAVPEQHLVTALISSVSLNKTLSSPSTAHNPQSWNPDSMTSWLILASLLFIILVTYFIFFRLRHNSN